MNALPEKIIVCSPTSEGPPGIPESTKLYAECGHEVWIAPSGLAFHKKDPVTQLFCFYCAMKLAKIAQEMGEPVNAHLVPGALGEFHDVIDHLKGDV